MKVTQEDLQVLTALIDELKTVRRVRTPRGSQYYGQPIGTPIVRDVPFDSTALLSHPAITSLPPALGEAPLPDGFVRMYHQTPSANLPSIREEGLLWDRGRGFEGPKGVWISDKPFYESSPNLATIEIAIPAEDREQMGRIASIGDIPPERFLTINEEWHDRVRQIVQEQRYMDALANGEYDDVLEDESLADDPSVRAIRYIRDNILNAESYDSWRDVEFDSSEHDPNLDYYLQEPNPPAKLYHVAPSSARGRITTDGLDASGNTWNTGAGTSDQWRDEWLWTVGDDGEEFAYEYRPTGVYMFQSLERAMQYYNDGEHDIYEIDTVENDRQIIRDPSQAMNWEYEDEFDRAYVTRYVKPSALRLLDTNKNKTELSIPEGFSENSILGKDAPRMKFDTKRSVLVENELEDIETDSLLISMSSSLARGTDDLVFVHRFDGVKQAVDDGNWPPMSKPDLFVIQKNRWDQDSIIYDPQRTIDGPRLSSPDGEKRARVTAVDSLILMWSVTANDHSIAIAFQDAIQKEFEIEDYANIRSIPGVLGTTDPKNIESSMQNLPTLQAIARAQYDVTQKLLSDADIKAVTLYRGTKEFGDIEMDALPVKLRPASSWTTDIDVAKKFTEDVYAGNGVMFKMTIPASKVLSLPSTGFGDRNESEVVILGGKYNVEINTLNTIEFFSQYGELNGLRINRPRRRRRRSDA